MGQVVFTTKMHHHLLLLLFLAICGPALVSGYCWAAGRNPGFSGSPKVEQIKIDVVRVSWHNIVIMRECADNFVVKYWPRTSPNEYQITELVASGDNHTDITVIPKIYYQFQAVAREDKGVIGGVDWNKSPIVDFRTTTDGEGKVDEMTEQLMELKSGGGENGGHKRVPLDEEEETQLLVMGLSVEVFVGVVVLIMVGGLSVIGILYKIVAGHRKTADDDNDIDEEEEEEDEEEEEEEDDDDEEEGGGKREKVAARTADSLVMETEVMAPTKNAP